MAGPTPLVSVQLTEIPQATPTPVAMDNVNGNLVVNTGKTVFRFKNSGSAGTVTVQTIVQEDGLILPGKVLAIPATTGDVEVAGFSPAIYGAECIMLASAATISCSVTEP